MKFLVTGWFSFENGHVTAGDILAAELACKWLKQAGYYYDIAFAPPFSGGVNWRHTDPNLYTHVLFVCGPFQKGDLESEFLLRFAGCRLVGLDLTMIHPLEVWNPFDFLIERDSSQAAHPDIVFATQQPLVTVVGVCLVEPYPGAIDHIANEAINRFLASREVAIVNIDTRLDTNNTGLRSSAEIESLIARMDVVFTTRLHGTVLALKNGVPVIAIDPEAGGAKIKRQAETIGWPIVFAADALTDESLQEAFAYCLSDAAVAKAKECAKHANQMIEEMKHELLRALATPDGLENKYQSRAKTLVSVVIPCYNQAHFLGEAIESVLAQTYRHFEIIVIDDGSPDNTAEVASRYPEARYIRQENQGLSGARNTGFRESQGKYLVFLDADDRLLSGSLQSGINCLHVHPECAFVSGHHRYIKADGSLLNEYPPDTVYSNHYTALLKGNYIGMHATVMYRRSVFEKVGLFNTSLKSCEDYEMYLRITRKFPVYCHKQMVAEYRWHNANMTRNSKKMLAFALQVLDSQWDYINNNQEYIQAYQTGIEFWRNYFGMNQIKVIRKYFSQKQWLNAVQQILIMASCRFWWPILLHEVLGLR
ncbi:MAG: glycosyltransferase, partial [Candidatus Brocadia sp.]